MNQPSRPRYAPQTASRQIRPRSQEVIDYHNDEQKPGKPIACTHCGRPYVPAETQYACPNCGAPAPAELYPSK